MERYIKRLSILELYLGRYKEKSNDFKSQLNKIQQEKLTLENEIATKNQQIKSLRNDIDANDSLKEKNNNLLQENEEFKEKIIFFQQQNLQISNLQAEIKKLSKDLEQNRNEKNSIQNDMFKITQKNIHLETENKRQIDTHIHLNNTIKSLNCIIQNKETEINDLQTRINQLIEKLNELNIRYTSGQQENDSLRQSIRKINTDINSLLKENNKYEHTTVELTKINQTNELIIQENKNTISTNTQLLNKKDNEIATLKHENDKLIEKLIWAS